MAPYNITESGGSYSISTFSQTQKAYNFSYIDQCESLSGGTWSLSNNTGNATIEVDSSDYYDGNSSIKANLQRTDRLRRTFSTPVDFSNGDLTITMKISTFTNQLQFRMFFFDGADYFQIQQSITDPHILRENEWFVWRIYKTNVASVSGSPSWDNIDLIHFYPLMDAGAPEQTIDLNVDNIRLYNKMPAPLITFRFDDSLDEHYDAAVILNGFGYSGIEAVMTGEVGGAGRLTLEEMTQMQTWGWDICSHYLDNTDLTTIPIATATAGIQTAKTYLVNNGFSKGARFLVYPQGAFNDEVEEVVNQYHVMAAVSANSTAYNHLSDFNLHRLGYYDPTDLTTATGLIDDAISNNYHLTLGFHSMSDMDLLTGVANYVQANGIEVVTFSDIYDKYYKSNNKTYQINST
jgi:hypothetical protein